MVVAGRTLTPPGKVTALGFSFSSCHMRGGEVQIGKTFQEGSMVLLYSLRPQDALWQGVAGCRPQY